MIGYRGYSTLFNHRFLGGLPPRHVPIGKAGFSGGSRIFGSQSPKDHRYVRPSLKADQNWGTVAGWCLHGDATQGGAAHIASSVGVGELLLWRCCFGSHGDLGISEISHFKKPSECRNPTTEWCILLFKCIVLLYVYVESMCEYNSCM